VPGACTSCVEGRCIVLTALHLMWLAKVEARPQTDGPVFTRAHCKCAPQVPTPVEWIRLNVVLFQRLGADKLSGSDRSVSSCATPSSAYHISRHSLPQVITASAATPSFKLSQHQPPLPPSSYHNISRHSSLNLSQHQPPLLPLLTTTSAATPSLY
jgi:hypothetical protein